MENTPRPTTRLKPSSMFGGQSPIPEETNRGALMFEHYFREEVGKFEHEMNSDEEAKFREICMENFSNFTDEEKERMLPIKNLSEIFGAGGENQNAPDASDRFNRIPVTGRRSGMMLLEKRPVRQNQVASTSAIISIGSVLKLEQTDPDLKSIFIAKIGSPAQYLHEAEGKIKLFKHLNEDFQKKLGASSGNAVAVLL